MPKMMSHFTDMARRDVDPDVIAAVPTRNPSVRAAAAGGMVAGSLGPLVTAITVAFLATVGRAVLSRRSAHDQARLFTIMIVLHQDAATMHRRRWFGRRIGPTIERVSLDGARDERLGMAVETQLTLDGIEWLVPGWYERDLRAALRSIGQAGALEEL